MILLTLRKSRWPFLILITFYNIFWITYSAFGQNIQTKKIILSGNIFSEVDSLPLQGTSVRVLNKNLGTLTDNQGNFNLEILPGNYILEISNIGFQIEIRKIRIRNNQNLKIYLQAKYQQGKEILVKSKRTINSVKNLEMGIQRLEMKTIRKFPALLGEPDVIRSVLSLPGVSTVGEGATGFNVRGGGVDQNLILMDQQGVYNSSHLFGFFSVYNPEAVDDATLIKGGIPAQYGGRLASILDVKMASGNPLNIEGSGGLGTVSTRLGIGGPIQKNKSEFFFSARRSYVDLFLKFSKDPATKQTYAYYYDLNTKLNFHLSTKDELEVMGYYGRDIVNLAGIIDFNYGNGLGGIGWKHQYHSGLKSNFNFGFSNYDNSVGIPTGVNGFKYQNSIFNYQAKLDFDSRPDSLLRFKFGLSAIRYQVIPGTTKPTNDSSFLNPFSINNQRAYEYGAYFQAEQKINPELSLQYGLRLSAFDYVSTGADTIYSYSGVLGQALNPVNSAPFSKGKSIKTYFNIEPRLSLRYLLNESSSLKLSYNRTTQYIHLISNTTAASPFDIWATTSNNIAPERADQVSIGYFKNFPNNQWEGSAEVYYKKSYNQIDYINGAQTILNKNLEGELLFGNGRSYGLELYLKKNYGKLTGWLSYTLSKTERKIEGINSNSWYPAKYDRTHNLALVGVYNFSNRWDFSANFTLQTGITTTFPDSRFNFQSLIIPYNSSNSRNNYRLPSYNRLDLSTTLHNRIKPGRKFYSTWVFSLYNVYGRRNAYSIYFKQDPNNANQTQAVRLSILGSAIPGITWNFNF